VMRRYCVSRGDSPNDEGSEERAEAARGEEESDAERASLEHFLAEDAQHGDDAGAHSITTLGSEQSQHARISSRVAERFANRFQQRRLLMLLALLCEGRAHEPKEDRRHQETRRVDHE